MREELADLAATSGGVVLRGRALEVGIPVSAIDSAVRSGSLKSLHPGVYRVAGVPDGLSLRRRAAVLAGGPGAVLSHRSAALVHGLTGGTPRPIEITVLYQQRPVLDGVVVHRAVRLPVDHWGDTDGVPTTTVERTLADLGAVLRPWTVAQAVQNAVVRSQTTPEQLYRLVDEHGRKGRSGIGALRAALDDWVLSESPPESVLELMFARLVERSALPKPVLQHEIRRPENGSLVARLDAAWPDRLVGAEVDGLAHHGTASALQRDLKRQNAIVLAGWTLLRFTWNDVVRRPSRVTRELIDALDA